MSQVFHLDVVKVDLGVAHIAMEPICSSHLLQLLGLPACAWVWRGRHGAGAGHEARTGHGAGVVHETAWATVRIQDTELCGPHMKQA
jgi:hypothetical protein